MPYSVSLLVTLSFSIILLQLAILSVWVISVDAKPCKMIFMSSYAFSFKQNLSSSSVFTVATEISHFNPRTTFNRAFPSDILVFTVEYKVRDRLISRDNMTLRLGLKKSLYSSYDFSSLQDRTKDILNMVLALLYGVCCGPPSVATLYLVWSSFSNQRYNSLFYKKNDHREDNEFNPKKKECVKISIADSMPASAYSPA